MVKFICCLHQTLLHPLTLSASEVVTVDGGFVVKTVSPPALSNVCPHCSDLLALPWSHDFSSAQGHVHDGNPHLKAIGLAKPHWQLILNSRPSTELFCLGISRPAQHTARFVEVVLGIVRNRNQIKKFHCDRPTAAR